MTVIGSWSDAEMRASYTPSGIAVVAGVVVVVLVGATIGIWGSNSRKQLLVAWGVACLGASVYVYLVQWLARALCVEAPLNVKVQGVFVVPFFLGTKDIGLLVLFVLFAVVNVLVFTLCRERRRFVPTAALFNVGLTGVLSVTALIAYAAVCMGFGVIL
jgi:hypothetical protein